MNLSNFVIYVASFSYLSGEIPRDPFGHGGGFVFDCRIITNPGRLKEYADFTGLQKSVKDWMEANPDTHAYWEKIKGIIEFSLQRAEEKGYSELSFAFGCTGGRHRSVYFAERVASWLRQNGATVILEHIQLKALGLI